MGSISVLPITQKEEVPMTDKVITVLEETENGVKKSIRVGDDADALLNKLKLAPTLNVFVKEVTRKLKKKKE